MHRDVFGLSGDFTTAPEISQMFGEVRFRSSDWHSVLQLVGVFLSAQWIQLGQPAKVRLIELGPGRGTLMADVLRVRCSTACLWLMLQAAKSVSGFQSSLVVSLVEVSPKLRSLILICCALILHSQIQHNALTGASHAPSADLSKAPYCTAEASDRLGCQVEWYSRLVGLLLCIYSLLRRMTCRATCLFFLVWSWSCFGCFTA
jgi:NADH dehydrogenase [ubiquinone] 1 alpha subcomplex assembly factor 7